MGANSSVRSALPISTPSTPWPLPAGTSMRVEASPGIRLLELIVMGSPGPRKGGAGWSLRDYKDLFGHLIYGEAHRGPERGKDTLKVIQGCDRAGARTPASCPEPKAWPGLTHPPAPQGWGQRVRGRQQAQAPGFKVSSWSPGEASSIPCPPPVPPLGRLEATGEESATLMGKKKGEKSHIYSAFLGARQVLVTFASL